MILEVFFPFKLDLEFIFFLFDLFEFCYHVLDFLLVRLALVLLDLLHTHTKLRLFEQILIVLKLLVSIVNFFEGDVFDAVTKPSDDSNACKS